MAHTKDDDLDFTGQFAKYKASPPETARAAIVPQVESAARLCGQALAQAGFHLLPRRKREGGPPNRSVFLADGDAAATVRSRHVLVGADIGMWDAADARHTSRLLSKVPVPGMFLIDAALPGGVDGLGLLRLIRKHPAIAPVPVVLITRPDALDEIAGGIRDGADGFVVRSLPPEDLVRVVRELLGD